MEPTIALIVAPIDVESPLVVIAGLYHAVVALLERRLLLSSPEECIELASIIAEERGMGRYGDGLTRAIVRTQEENALEPTGTVDQPTADVINRLLERAGLLGPLLEAAPTMVPVRVEISADVPAPGVTVELRHVPRDGPAVPLGNATTDVNGGAVILFRRRDYALRQGDPGATLGFALSRDGVPLAHRIVSDDSRGGVLIDYHPNNGPVLLRLEQSFGIGGVVTTATLVPLPGLQLVLHRLEFGGVARQVGETTTGRDGRYLLPYDPGQGNPVLEIRAILGDRQIPLSRPLSGLGPDERLKVGLTAPDELLALTAEHGRMAEDIVAQIGNLAALGQAKETTGQQDLTVLARSTGWDARLLATAARAERLAAEPTVALPSDGLYGLLRAGLPAEREALARVKQEAVSNALELARKVGIVNMSEADANAFKDKFGKFARTTRLLAKAPGSTSSYRQLIDTVGIEAVAAETFADVVLTGARGQALWDAADKAGVAATDVSRLQRHGKLAFLAGNSAQMTLHLMTRLDGETQNLVANDLYRPDKWRDELFAAAGVPEAGRGEPSPEALAKVEAILPPVYVGKTVEDRMSAYANDMARKVRLSYPTETLARRIETGAARTTVEEVAEPTAKLLQAAARKGFRIGATPVATFLNAEPSLAAEVGTGFDRAADELKSLHRLYQLTPTDDAIPVLQAMGLTTAQQIAAIPLEFFVDGFIETWGEIHGDAVARGVPQLIRRKAEQISSVVYSLFSTATKLKSEPPIPALGGTPAGAPPARDELIRRVPTLSSLFGDMDYAEVDEFRTVLSPSAYLVDILQMIDPEPQYWANFLKQWEKRTGRPYPHQNAAGVPMTPYDVLVERRPDLPHIELSGENTSTVLPYIDVVNEILEYFVAHSGLSAEAAHDTEGATGPDLLAEPQNIIPKAYEILRNARYPLGLPFDQPLEAVRALLDRLALPLPELLETFRRTEDLFQPDAAYDRAAIFLETLGLSPGETAIFADRQPLTGWFGLYGLANDPIDPATGERRELSAAKTLSRSLRVSYREITEIVQTGFVNPKLQRLALLYALGQSIGEARIYLRHKNLLGADPATLSVEQRRLQQTVKAFAAALAALAGRVGVPVATLDAAIAAIPFDRALVFADNDTGGSFATTTLRYADGTPAAAVDFLRINLFVRLWRKLGWTIAETDRAIAGFLPSGAKYTEANFAKRPLLGVLIQIAHLKALEERLKPGREGRLALLSFWRNIATGGPQSPYARLLLTRQVLASDDVFDDALGEYLSAGSVAAHAARHVFHVEMAGVSAAQSIDPAPFAGDARIAVAYDPEGKVQHLSFKGILSDADKAALAELSSSPKILPLLEKVQAHGAAYGFVKGHSLALQGALGLTAPEVTAILKEARPALTPETAALDLANISLLYRFRTLSRLLNLPVADVIALRQISGIDPFAPLPSEPIETIADDRPLSATLAFVVLAEELKASGLDVPCLDALLRQRQLPEVAATESVSRRTLLQGLSSQIAAIRSEHAVPDDPAIFTDSVLQQKLGLVFPGAVATRFMTMLAGTAEFSASKEVAADAKIEPADIIAGGPIAAVAYEPNGTRGTQTLTLRGFIHDTTAAAIIEAHAERLSANALATLRTMIAAARSEGDKEAKTFFETHLEAETLAPDVVSGFLAEDDIKLLFEPPPADASNTVLEKLDRDRRKRLAEVFLPFLQRVLIRRAIIETLAIWAGAPPETAEALLTESSLLALDGKRLLNPLEKIGEQGLSLSVAGASTVILPGGDTGAKTKAGELIRPSGNKATLSGYFQVPASGGYRFSVGVDKAGATAMLILSDLATPVVINETAATNGDVLGPDNQVVALKAGALYRVELKLENLGGGQARLLIQGETLSRGGVERLPLLPEESFAAADRAAILFAKAVGLAGTLGLDLRDLRHMLTHVADFGNLSLSTLSTAPVGDSEGESAAIVQSFNGFRQLAGYARLKLELAKGSDDLITLFEANAAAAPDPEGDTGEVPDRLGGLVYPLLARLTGRSIAEVTETARLLDKEPSFPNHTAVLRLSRALACIGKIGISPADVVAVTGIVAPGTPAPRRHAIARALREAIHARVDEEGWRRLAKPVFDVLRQRQRDALVAHTLRTLKLSRVEELYEHFLVDPGMEPVVETSRIRLAIGTVQTFIRRILLNLEPKVHPSIINAAHWEWMKMYRVWEANRKIFLFPENWLEPEFRDDKSDLFKELEGTLLKDDVSADMVEDAFLTYLRGLDALARLEVFAMHLQDSPEPAARVLHVFGRSFSEPHSYFYRRYRNEAWTAWEPVEVDITGDHIAPVFWRDRLYLFWVTFMPRADDSPASQSNPATAGTALAQAKVGALLTDLLTSIGARRQVDVTLHWAEYANGSWTMQEGGGQGTQITQTVQHGFSPRNVLVHVSSEILADGEGGVFVHLTGDVATSFYLAGRNSPVERSAPKTQELPVINVRSFESERYNGSGPLEVFVIDRKTVDGQLQPISTRETILGSGRNWLMLPLNGPQLPWGAPADASAGGGGDVAAAIAAGIGEIQALARPFFYSDRHNTFFVQPDVTEKTIVEWEDWVTPQDPPAGGGVPDGGGLGGALPKIPQYIAVEPEKIGPRPYSIVDIATHPVDQDWLTNPHTVVEFDGALLGSQGQLGTVVATQAPQSGNALNQLQLVSTVDGLAVVQGAQSLTGIELTASNGINLVGAGGFSPAMAENLKTNIFTRAGR
ncbi:neuraminidase-like domain-containing protein [Rhizobium mongolense]